MKKKEERKNVDVRICVDYDRLYGGIDEAIKYLKEIKEQYRGTNIGLYERWTGYEDMEMTFVYSRVETDDEFSDRLKREQTTREYVELQIKAAEERENDLAELLRLKSKLGMR